MYVYLSHAGINVNYESISITKAAFAKYIQTGQKQVEVV